MTQATKNTGAIVLEAATREGSGKGAARALRRAEQVPGVIYSAKSAPVSIALSEKHLRMAYQRGRFTNKLLEIKMNNGETLQALPKEVQTHPVTDRIEHVDFMRVQPGEVILVAVPVKVLGAEKSVGLKRGGTLNLVRHEIDLLCKPEAIPAAIEVNVAELNIGSSVHIGDITLPAGVTPKLKRNFTVLTVAGRTSQAEEVAAPTAAAAAPAAGAAAPAAGAAAPAAGAKDAKPAKK